MRVAVVGAGIAGLSAARTIADAGHSVTVLDKGRRPGGRLATRLLEGGAAADHGAQFITVRDEEFERAVTGWMKAGVIGEWCRGFAGSDGHPRYVARGGMASLGRRLSEGLDVRCSTHVETVRSRPGGWLLSWPAAHGGDGGSIEVEAVVLTPPVPQSAKLLGPEVALPAVEYEPVLALLLALDGDAAVPDPGGVQLSEDPTWGWIADNVAKGVSERPALTFHTTAAFARARWEQDAQTLTDELIAAAEPWLGGASPLDSVLHRWLYAAPLEPKPERCLTGCADGLVLAGDAFGEPRVEGAFLSGLAAGQAVLGLER